MRALITGVTGQDGAYLSKFLLDKGYEVFGTFRRISTPNFWRLQYMDIFDKINMMPMDLSDSASITEAIKISNPDEIYHLAAQSHVGASFEQPIATGNITGLGVTRMLEAIRHNNPDIKFYQASTSELFGNSPAPQNEDSVFMPTSPYASAKLYAHHIVKIYREGYGLFAVNGILYNHESPLRGLEFVTRKVTNAVAKIHFGLEPEIRLGNLDAKRDWGFAGDYVEAMWLMLQQKNPDDFVIATGETHSVRELCEEAFGIAGMDYNDFVMTDKRFFRPLETNCLCGDYSKAHRLMGWKPKVNFKKLVSIMVNNDMSRWQEWLNGKRFPWDAPNYPNENKIVSRSMNMDR